jgi:hypothetical protein
MLCFARSTVVLAGVLATAQPDLADPLAAAAYDRAQAAATERAAPPTPTGWPSSSDASAPASAGLGKDIVPVGFGWG